MPWLRADRRSEAAGGAGDWLDERLGGRCIARHGQQSLLLDLSLIAPGGLTPHLVETLESAGPSAWAGPARASPWGRCGWSRPILSAPITSHADRAGETARFKAIAFRAAETELGQALLHGARGAICGWQGARARSTIGARRPQAELHIEDAAFAD
jgi:single-stranded-DNA-specific exonuclease